ncbi:sigma-70 family RNA polymerase sigma factor [Amycolatopsis rubida]|uniref:Sigma-70 family RNA polymerase sigma factor n=1 Tax=Amycolatopsis rubida TaxID=112413 RepID=A0ABX0BPI2_9PSEU|nr:sigma-70 family RNA polymerase sigma factor [Amycolatopsis rubida]NEC55247.1 sigma-70 family RNA polymerase sigma factor [Amycolatopsis rubida]
MRVAGFDGFFRGDFPRLVAFLCAGGLGPGTAREVAVEAFVQETGTWPPPGDPRVAVRLTAVRLAAEQTWFDGGDPSADPPGDRLTSVVERNARGVELLATLPETQRTVLTWSLDGFSPAAIASALGMAGTTVRSNLRHARERLKHRLGLAGREEALMTALREAEGALVSALRSALDVEEALTRVKTEATALAAPRVQAGRFGFDGPVRAAVEGDPDAAQDLLAAVQPLIVRYCRARLGGADAYSSADDVAQEACLALLTALPGYRHQGRPFLAFVYGIAQHKVADAHRAHARNRTEAVAEVPEAVDLADGPEERALRAELNRQLARLLELLPERQREIVLLRIVVGLSADEAAEAVSSTPGAVRVAQHRALLRLRSALERRR